MLKQFNVEFMKNWEWEFSVVAAPLSQTHTGLTLPDLSPHCNYTVPVLEKEPTIGGNVSVNKMVSYS